MALAGVWGTPGLPRRTSPQGSPGCPDPPRWSSPTKYRKRFQHTQAKLANQNSHSFSCHFRYIHKMWRRNMSSSRKDTCVLRLDACFCYKQNMIYKNEFGKHVLFPCYCFWRRWPEEDLTAKYVKIIPSLMSDKCLRLLEHQGHFAPRVAPQKGYVRLCKLRKIYNMYGNMLECNNTCEHVILL